MNIKNTINIKYRKKPITVEAMRIEPDNISYILMWGNGKIRKIDFDCLGYSSALSIMTSTGEHKARTGDWIVKGINGEFYAMPNDTFIELYEIADESTETDGGIPVINWEEKV